MRIKFLLFALLSFPVVSYAQNSIVDVSGYVVNDLGESWSEQQAVLYQGDEVVGETSITNGYFEFGGVITGSHLINTENNIRLYPNPISLSGVIEVGMDQTQDVVLQIVSISGQEIERRIFSSQQPGTHLISFGGTLNPGVYIVSVLVGNKRYTQKFIKSGIATDGDSHINNVGTPLIKSSTPELFSLLIRGDSVVTTIIDSLDFPQTGEVELSTVDDPFVAPRRPVLIGKVYDLETKWNEKGERTPNAGIPNMKVFVKSHPEDFVLTDDHGWFCLAADISDELMVDSTEAIGSWYLKIQAMDSLYITGQDLIHDTTYYSFKTPIGQRLWGERVNNGEIVEEHFVNTVDYGTNIITAFNDTTGIPMFKRYVDPENGVDMLEHLQYVTNIEEKFAGDLYWEHITSRMRDEDLVGGIKTFMNRDAAPNDYYADSAWAGLKAAEVGRFKFQETNDIDSALLVMEYTNNMVGQGIILASGEDNKGYFLTKFKIVLRGPPNGPAMTPDETVYLNAHECYHIAYYGGKHSPYIEDIFFLDPLTRYDYGYVDMLQKVGV